MSKQTSILLIFLAFICSACSGLSQTEQSAPLASVHEAQVDFGGWDYLVGRLRADGIREDLLRSVYASTRMPPFENIPFALNPKESSGAYARFNDRARIERARNFLHSYSQAFSHAETIFAVNRYVIAAILLIETDLGRNTGRELVVYRLSRLASISDPANIEWNYSRLRKDDPRVTLQGLQIRAAYLDSLFFPELEALFKFAADNNTDVFQIRGSSAGAFGIPQFLPSSYLKFAVDGNRDGVASLFREEDAIASVANYLSKSGWSEEPRAIEARKHAIWKYNRSPAYVAAVLSVAASLRNSTRPSLPSRVRRGG